MTLIELMIVVAVLSALAMVAYPMFQRYVATAQLTAALAEIAPGKSIIDAAMADGVYGQGAEDLGLPTTSPRCAVIGAVVGLEVGHPSSISCYRLKGNKSIAGRTIWFNRNFYGADSDHWTCHSNIKDEKLLPKGCEQRCGDTPDCRPDP